MTPSCKGPIQTFSTSFGTCICLCQWSIICYMKNCVAWFLMWISLSVKHKLSSTDILQLKSHIGKPFATREGVKQMKAVKECVNNPPCLVKLVLWNICLVTKHGRTQREWCGLFWLKDDLCDHFMHNAMKAWERLIAAKNSNNNITFSWRRSHFFPNCQVLQ